MSISFYDASVGTYLQILDATAGVLARGAAHAAATGLDPQEIVMTRLSGDMMPFHFQVVASAHLSWGALQAMQTGTFRPPSFELDKDYAGLQALVTEARDGIAAMDRAKVEALGGGTLAFKLGKTELPFTNPNFLLSFSLPNFYFHATTAYNILRMLGTPLGKANFLGQMKMGI